MALNSKFSIKDLPYNKTKKLVFILCGLILFLMQLVILLNIPSQYVIIRYIFSGIFILLCIFLVIPVVFLSFIDPIILFKNIFLRLAFPFIFISFSYILPLIFKNNIFVNIISLIISINGFMFSGIRPELNNKILHYIKLFNYGVSRLIVILNSVFLLIDITKIIYRRRKL